jgi:hypothetical protein
VILALLKRYLFSDGIGLVSHGLLSKGIGIYVVRASVVACGILMSRRLRLLLSKRNRKATDVLIGIFQLNSDVVLVECPADITFGIFFVCS